MSDYPSEKQFEALFQHTLDAVLIANNDRCYVDANPAACDLLGLSRDEILQRCIEDLTVPGVHSAAEKARIEEYWRQFMEQGEQEGEMTLFLPDGTTRDVEYRAKANFIPGFHLSVLRDRTEHNNAAALRDRLLAQEREARAEADEANRQKDEFLAVVSHELRSPIQAVLGWVSIARTEQLPPEQLGHALEVIERNARAEVRLIEDLLDISRATSGKLKLNIESASPAAVVGAAVEATRPEAAAKNIGLRLQPAPGLPPLACDPHRLQQVVRNLLSNAVKFTPEGGAIDVRIVETDSRLEIIVHDTGEGIGADVLPHIFERFRQASDSPSRGHTGLGLGLAIVREIVELHGGTVRAQSDGDGQGATFTVTLPVAGAQ